MEITLLLQILEYQSNLQLEITLINMMIHLILKRPQNICPNRLIATINLVVKVIIIMLPLNLINKVVVVVIKLLWLLL